MSNDAAGERLRRFEDELIGLVMEGDHLSRDVAAEAVHRLVMLIGREVFLRGTLWQHDYVDRVRKEMQTANINWLNGWNRPEASAAANERFPLPPKRVLREEPDPEGGSIRWRYQGGLEYQIAGDRGWRTLTSIGAFAPTDKRIDLWHSLKHEPFREVPDEGDE